ncbi:DUF3891 family protein [Alkalicoccobacillus porphyridii]|uniref:DUF3891 family protein n=1 Tax=Alkalicoccobacillus porphyridii TaxID=2597270 RepID=UPI00163D6A9D|nr:DUF3891 family protein [Alkalicoccobacillus porphyridii]
MIIRQKAQEIECIKQHDHAYISGKVAEHWIEAVHDEVKVGIFEHDRAWIPLDEYIEKDPERNLPHDFISYPLQPKLQAYTRGLDEVQEQSAYASLLCSRHYCSFFSGTITSQPEVKQFLEQERLRQTQILEQLQPGSEEDIEREFKLLQFCDDVSLYICMNPPGIPKSDEVSWFRDGFSQTFSFAPDGIHARWLNDTDIQLKPFPFIEPLTLSFPVYTLPQSAFNERQSQLSFDQLPNYTQTVTFLP